MRYACDVILTRACRVVASSRTLFLIGIAVIIVCTNQLKPAGAQTAPTQSQLIISEIFGLSEELAVRPMYGPSYAPGRAAVISPSGLIEAASGDLSDCIRVDGSSGPCGAFSDSSSANPPPTFVENERPAGILDGKNLTLTLAHVPNPSTSVRLYRNGLRLAPSVDYTVAGATITIIAPAPQPSDVLIADYRY